MQGGSDKKYQYKASVSCNWDERNTNRFSSINWRASLVPAAAVIPAPTAYIKVVAVRTLVVGYLLRSFGPPLVECTRNSSQLSLRGGVCALLCATRSGFLL